MERGQQGRIDHLYSSFLSPSRQHRQEERGSYPQGSSSRRRVRSVSFLDFIVPILALRAPRFCERLFFLLSTSQIDGQCGTSRYVK